MLKAIPAHLYFAVAATASFVISNTECHRQENDVNALPSPQLRPYGGRIE